MAHRSKRPTQQPTEQELATRNASENARRAQLEAEAPEWAWLAAELEAAGVDTRDLGRFVNDTRFIRPSEFDEVEAMPVLLRALPRLTHADVVAAVAAHLDHRGARPVAFPVLLAQFQKWARLDSFAGDSLASALVTASGPSDIDDLLDLAADERYGESRAGIVEALWRFRKDARVAPLLRRLLPEPDLCWAAMSALRRTVGNDSALPDLRRLRDTTGDPMVRQYAAEQIERAERAARR